MTEGELLKAIEEAFAQRFDYKADHGALHTPELAELLGWSYDKVRRALRPLIKSGAWESVMAPTTGIDGVVQMRAAYRPKKAGPDE